MTYTIKYCLHLISIGHFLKVHRAIFILCLLLPTPAFAATPFSAWAVKQADEFLANYAATVLSDKGYRSSYKIGNIDPRLTLTPCSVPIDIKLQSDPLTRSKNTLKLVCNQQKRWTMFVGVSIDLFKEVWVASKPLARHHHLIEGDLELSDIQVNQSRKSYYTEKTNLIGMKLKRSLDAGRILYPGLLSTPSVIEKGDTVLITALSNIISVEMLGTAMSDGKQGQQISVKNQKSSRVIRATVVSKGKVKVML